MLPMYESSRLPMLLYQLFELLQFVHCISCRCLCKIYHYWWNNSSCLDMNLVIVFFVILIIHPLNDFTDLKYLMMNLVMMKITVVKGKPISKFIVFNSLQQLCCWLALLQFLPKFWINIFFHHNYKHFAVVRV